MSGLRGLPPGTLAPNSVVQPVGPSGLHRTYQHPPCRVSELWMVEDLLEEGPGIGRLWWTPQGFLPFSWFVPCSIKP